MADTFTPALTAIGNLLQDGFSRLDSLSGTHALAAHAEIETVPVGRKRATFFRYFFPLHREMVLLLADCYRRCFRIALAHASQTGGDPHTWAQAQLQHAIGTAREWICDWYTLACEGESQQPGSWRSPAWLFAVSPSVGIGHLKQHHVPNRDSVEKLSEAHTRLLLKGARRVFLWELRAVIETVRNQETAAAGTIPRDVEGKEAEQRSKTNHWLKGTEGLASKKADLSQYMDKLTKKQQLAFSLTYEYQLRPAEVASRMGVDRKTVYDHIQAVRRRIDQARLNEKGKVRRAKNEHE